MITLLIRVIFLRYSVKIVHLDQPALQEMRLVEINVLCISTMY